MTLTPNVIFVINLADAVSSFSGSGHSQSSPGTIKKERYKMFEYEWIDTWIKLLIRPLLYISGGEILVILLILFLYFALGGEKSVD